MARPNDFPPSVITAVALRAGRFCSFTGCRRVTTGPSDESPTAVTNVGEAAHIHAASPGGKRYLESMTSQACKDIANAIWLCTTHARLIDRDEVRYSAEVLRAMKASHERWVAEQVSSGAGALLGDNDLLSIGPDVVAVGEVVGAEAGCWSVRLQDFVRGDLTALIGFVDAFELLPRTQRYLLVESLGDGRVLSKAPTWRREGAGILVQASVEPPFARTTAQEIGEDLKVVDGDLTPDLRMVSGVDALPQRIQICLWWQQGQHPWLVGDLGSRLAEYYALFGQTHWMVRLAKLETIRLAAIPFFDDHLQCEYTPFLCVKRVYSIEFFAETPTDEWLPANIDLEVAGLGRWKHNIKLHIPQFPFEPVELPSFADLTFPPKAR